MHLDPEKKAHLFLEQEKKRFVLVNKRFAGVDSDIIEHILDMKE
jgi:hypothetical protein